MRSWRPLVFVLLFASSCARTSGAIEIPADDLPFSVRRGATVSPSPLTPQTFVVAFVRAGRLVEVRRRVGAKTADAEAAIRALLDGPTPAEGAQGIASELSAEVRLLQVSVGGETAHIDLSGEFQEPAPRERIALRVAQVVWTLTALVDIRSVTFAIDGEPIDVAAADGTPVEGAATRLDYAGLAPAR